MKNEKRNPVHVLGRFIFFFVVLTFFHGFEEITLAVGVKLFIYALVVTLILELVRHFDKKRRSE